MPISSPTRGSTTRSAAEERKTLGIRLAYPKDDTPGCTTQACSIRDRGEEYTAAAATVLGVSPDPVIRTYWGAQRATFVIDPDGEIVHVIPKASPKTHDDEVLEALAALSTAD